MLVTHGVPAHNPFLHMFEADKDCVYLDYGSVTIVEKTGRSQTTTSNAQEKSSIREEGGDKSGGGHSSKKDKDIPSE